MLAGEAVVMNLSEPLLNHGYVIHLDNWYSSPTLFRSLLDNKTYARGTVRGHRKNMPTAVTTKFSAGEVLYQSSNNIQCLKWQDKNDVLMLSSLHQSPLMTNSGKTRMVEQKIRDHVHVEEVKVVKPNVVIDYNNAIQVSKSFQVFQL